MGSTLRASVVAIAAVAAAVSAAIPAAADEEPHVPLPAEQTLGALAATAPCDPNGANAADAELAARLNSVLTKDMRGYMSAYRASCARQVVKAVRDRGLDKKAAVIAITTVIVETHLQNISEEVDHDSLGLFQQRASWGSAANRLNPIWATNAFLNSMISKYPNNSWMNATTDAQIGAVCQRVQVSAYPDRYAVQVSDAKIIVDHLWRVPGRDSTGYYSPVDGSFHLRNALSSGASDHAWDTDLNTAVPNAVVLRGDWDGNGRDSTGYYHPGDGSFHLGNDLGNSPSEYAWDTNLNEALPNAVILVGDWNNDGKDSVGYYSPVDGSFHLRNALSSGASDYAWDTDLNTALPNAVVLVGDWNNDGRDSTGYYNPTDGSFHLGNDFGNSPSEYAWDTNLNEALPNAVILVGDWNGDGRDSTGYYSPVDGSFHLRNALNSGASDYAWDTDLNTALPNAVVLVGDWNGV
jgi:hypothetical protein